MNQSGEKRDADAFAYKSPWAKVRGVALFVAISCGLIFLGGMAIVAYFIHKTGKINLFGGGSQ